LHGAGPSCRYVSQEELGALFSGPTTDDILGFSGNGGASGAAATSPSGSTALTITVSNPSDPNDRGTTLLKEVQLPSLGSSVKKLREDEKWRKRRMAMKKMVEQM
jgi:hypothetical protein